MKLDGRRAVFLDIGLQYEIQETNIYIIPGVSFRRHHCGGRRKYKAKKIPPGRDFFINFNLIKVLNLP